MTDFKETCLEENKKRDICSLVGCNNQFQYQKSLSEGSQWTFSFLNHIEHFFFSWKKDRASFSRHKVIAFSPFVLKASSNWETILRIEWVRSQKETRLKISLKGKVQPLLLSESSNIRKGLQWGELCARVDFSQTHRTGQIRTDWERALPSAKDVFPCLAFQDPEFKASWLLFYAGANWPQQY